MTRDGYGKTRHAAVPTEGSKEQSQEINKDGQQGKCRIRVKLVVFLDVGEN